MHRRQEGFQARNRVRHVVKLPHLAGFSDLVEDKGLHRLVPPAHSAPNLFTFRISGIFQVLRRKNILENRILDSAKKLPGGKRSVSDGALIGDPPSKSALQDYCRRPPMRLSGQRVQRASQPPLAVACFIPHGWVSGPESL